MNMSLAISQLRGNECVEKTLAVLLPSVEIQYRKIGQRFPEVSTGVLSLSD